MAESLLEPILALHDSIRDAVVDACTRQSPEQLATTAGDAGDTIYAIDRVGEEVLVGGLRGLARDEPVCVVAEGIPDPLILRQRQSLSLAPRGRISGSGIASATTHPGSSRARGFPIRLFCLAVRARATVAGACWWIRST